MRKAPFLCFILFILLQGSSGILHGEKVKGDDVLNSFVHFGSGYDDNFVCGGILITWKHIITAAHCGIDASLHRAYFGTKRLHSEDALYIADLEDTSYHQCFTEDNINPDIAIISIKEPSRTKFKSLGIYPIDIDWESSNLAFGQALQVMGFGCYKEDLGEGCNISPRLRKATGYLQATKRCDAGHCLSQDRRRIMCLDGRWGSVCGGDSGGPILIESKDNDTGGRKLSLVGVIIRVCTSGSKCENHSSFIGVAMERYRSWVIRRVGQYRRF